jgi:hypothetical protein
MGKKSKIGKEGKCKPCCLAGIAEREERGERITGWWTAAPIWCSGWAWDLFNFIKKKKKKKKT